jgi:(E)-4-hydroxy-3-methylbut-2-enyl-diphosphate synthase
VELELGAIPEDPKRFAEGLAAALGRLRELACEGVGVDAPDPVAASRLGRLAVALAEAGVELPLVVRAGAGCAEACAGPAARLVLPVAAGATPEGLAGAARCAVEAGIPAEWELRGRGAELAALLDRALAASAASGLEALLASVDTELPVHGVRLLAARLRARGVAQVPIVLRHRRDPARSHQEALLSAAVDLGAPLCDGIGDAVALAGFGDPGRGLDLAYRILQGARLRTSWTEFISCPSCGRTLFDLERTTARIRERTQHLRGIKIAIMGCIVNGPGEMADADFGYVGSGPGMVDLYLGKQRVARKLAEAEADERLVDLIRERGLWVEPG